MIRLTDRLSLVLVCLLLIGCGKQESKQTPAATETRRNSERQTGLSDVLLQTGYGAVLVKHPVPHRFSREQWMIQINLEGDAATKHLPVVPIADLQAGIVFNVPPGNYKVISSAWIRKYPPQSGGALDNVIVRPGEVVMLQAGGSGMDPYPYDNTPLELIGRHTWNLQSPGALQDFIAEILETPAAG